MMNGVWVDRVSLDDPHHRDQYRQDRLRMASVRASNDLMRRTLQARKREEAERRWLWGCRP